MATVHGSGVYPAGHPVYGAATLAKLGRASLNLAVFGDSRCANSTYNLGGSVRSEGNGLAFWAETLSRGRLRFRADLNFGLGGDKTNGMLARIDPVLSSDADVVAILASVNDNTFNDPLLADRMLNITTICEKLAAAGKLVVLPVAGWKLERTLYLVHLGGPPLSPTVRHFADLFPTLQGA